MVKIFYQDYMGVCIDIRKQENEQEQPIVVMVSGTFDVLHLGHMILFEEAKKRGDFLVVAVKSDNAARLKKEDPPLRDQEYRMRTVSHCIGPDYVILVDYDITRKIEFEFSNPAAFQWLNMFTPAVSIIRPDIFVHEDNPTIAAARKQLFQEYDVKGIIQPRTEGVSSTSILDEMETRVLKKLQKCR